MAESILNLKVKPNLCLIDGKEKIIIKNVKTKSIVGGDRKSISIAAASILAKVIRDSIMKKFHYYYPHYD
jgi:ribonuclease HII